MTAVQNLIESLEDLYVYLKDEEELDRLKNILAHWEFDFGLVKEDVNGEEDLKQEISNTLYIKLKSLINGDFSQIQTPNDLTKQSSVSRHSKRDPQLIKLKHIISQLKNDNAAQIIIEKITEEEFSFDGIKEDIEDKDDSIIYDYLKENDIEDVDIIFNQFMDMIHNLNHYDVTDAINITAGGPDCNIPFEHKSNVYIDSDEDEDDTIANKEMIYHTPIIEKKEEEELNHTDYNEEWNIVLQEIKNYTQFDGNIYEECIEYYRSDEYTIQGYLESEATTYENSLIQMIEEEAVSNLTDDRKRMLWDDVTKCVQSVQISRSRNKSIPKKLKPPRSSIPPKPKKQIKTNGNTYHIDSYLDADDDKMDEIPDIIDCNEFVDDEKSSEYRRVNKIISKFEKLHISTENQPEFKVEHGIAFRRLSAIFGMNSVLLMVDLKISMACIAFNHKTYKLMNEHLMEIEKDHIKNEYYKFVRYNFNANKYNLKKFGIYVQGLNVSQATRLLGYGKLSQIVVNIRNPANNDDFKDDDDDEDDDVDDEYDNDINNKCKIMGSDEVRLNWYSREAQQYIFAFIVAMTRHLLKDYGHLNCGVVLDLVIPSIDERKPKINELNNREIRDKEFRNRMDSLTGKFTPVFENNLIRPTFRKHIENGHKIPIWSIYVNKIENERDFEPHYMGITKKEIGIDLNEKEYIKHFDRNHWFHVMRVKRYFSEQTMNDKNNGNYKRLGIAIHKFQQTIKLMLHFEGGVIRIIPQDIVKWIPILFMYRENELKWNDIRPYLQNVLKDNKNLSVQQRSAQNNDDNDDNDDDDSFKPKQQNIWKQIKNWDQLDQDYIEKRNNLLKKIGNLGKMSKFRDVFFL